MRVSILSFSGRSGGNCGRIAQEIRRFWRDRGEAEVYDFSTFTVTPCGASAIFRGGPGCWNNIWR